MNKIKDHVNKLLNIISVIEDEESVKNIVDCYLTARPDIDRKAVIKGISESDNRFIGWDNVKIYTYDFSNVSGNSLYLKKAVADEILTNKYKMKLVLIKEDY